MADQGFPLLRASHQIVFREETLRRSIEIVGPNSEDMFEIRFISPYSEGLQLPSVAPGEFMGAHVYLSPDQKEVITSLMLSGKTLNALGRLIVQSRLK